VTEMEEAFATAPRELFVALDWSKAAMPISAALKPTPGESKDWWINKFMAPYKQAGVNTREVGKVMADKLAKEIAAAGVKVTVHCIGHSLGSHVCGMGSKAFNKGAKFARITALDPARPLFETSVDGVTVPSSERLDRSDAPSVIAIHTTNDLGFISSTGTVDFFVNGDKGGKEISKSQPGCGHGIIQGKGGEMAAFIDGSICSHSQANDLPSSIMSLGTTCTFNKCAPKSFYQTLFRQARANSYCRLSFLAADTEGCAGDYCGTTAAEAPFC